MSLAESWGCRLRDSPRTPTLFAPSKPRDVTTESGSVCALWECALCKPSGLHPARLEPRSIQDELGELALACVSFLSLLLSSPHPIVRSAQTFRGWRDVGFQHQEAVDLLWRLQCTLQRARADCNLLTTTLPPPPQIRCPRLLYYRRGAVPVRESRKAA